ncbi:MAG: HAD-IA family hydrolase [Gammaproteobacteria bacterium]|nr:HAD-IA family hydrolase [Gammaproteobacteria bacterium]
MKHELRTVLFDLDGTLADTAPDLAYALNAVLQEQNRPALPYERIRPAVSHGASALIRLGFSIEPGDANFEPLRLRLLDIYEQHLADQTALFPGVPELLTQIEQRGMNWGVITNKPAWLTEPLLDKLGLTQRAACIVSGDTTTRRKPDPEPMLYACNKSGSTVQQCVYIGDAERDIEAGKRAGMKTLVALFGYIAEGDTPHAWGADGMIDTPQDVLDWMDNHA